MILERIHSREDLLALTREEDEQLCREIRQFLIEHVSQTGGHLASNLGIVETTLAIQKAFDTSRDRLVFDVGHQSYVHKILTGRMDRFSTLRSFGGLSGFPKPSESVHDAFIAGHASNAVSVALGMARARTLRGEDHRVIALLGDGALTGGLAYEGLNNAGASREPLIVILNDNGMSITPNVGAISRYLAKMRLRPSYLDFKLWYRKFTSHIPGGMRLYSFTHKLKNRIRRRLIGKTLFEDMGFTYLGPVDGHDVETVTELLRASAALNEPVLLHLSTKKGKGFAPAEKTPQEFHGVGKFDPVTGKPVCQKKKTFASVFGETLTEMAREDASICAITAAMQQGVGLEGFAKAFPKRYFDVGIAEGHAVCMASGLAAQAMTPVVAIYSSFLQRAYDMLLHDVALMQLHVVFAVDHTGLVGADGETHHGIYDVGFLRQVPGMQVFCPASFAELRRMLRTAVLECSGPVAVRYPTGGEGAYTGCTMEPVFCEGTDCTLVTYGTLINSALEAGKLCSEKEISLEIVKLPKLAPLDLTAISASVRKTGRLLIVEEMIEEGSAGQEILSQLALEGLHPVCECINLGANVPPHGTIPELYQLLGLDGNSIYHRITEVMRREK